MARGRKIKVDIEDVAAHFEQLAADFGADLGIDIGGLAPRPRTRQGRGSSVAAERDAETQAADAMMSFAESLLPRRAR
ncbi:MAG: hypothetical protein AAF608_10335 [Pseudomonadota bacterium]